MSFLDLSPVVKKKYRFEQVVILKIDTIPISTSESFHEYILTIGNDLSNKYVKIEGSIEHNKIQPNNYQASIELANEVQLFKGNVICQLDESNKITKIVNLKEKFADWELFKTNFLERYSYLISNENRENVKNFLNVADKGIFLNEAAYIQELKTQLFFNILFEQNISSFNSENKDVTNPFYSQLFPSVVGEYILKTSIGHENKNEIEIIKQSKFNADKLDTDKLVAIYNERYLPIIRYPFSTYSFDYNANFFVERNNGFIKEGRFEFSESVKNNLQLIILGKIREVD